MTTKRGFRLSTSVGRILTGRGGNLIIIDDPIKPADAMSDTEDRGHLIVRLGYRNIKVARIRIAHAGPRVLEG
jgi:hypothetical protein